MEKGARGSRSRHIEAEIGQVRDVVERLQRLQEGHAFPALQVLVTLFGKFEKERGEHEIAETRTDTGRPKHRRSVDHSKSQFFRNRTAAI
jgi:hypothetical protein